MNQSDVDKLLKRRLYLQRYVTHLTNGVLDLHRPGDRALLRLVSDLVDNADERTLASVAKQRTGNPVAREFLGELRSIVKGQRNETLAMIEPEMQRLIEREIVVISGALGEKPTGSQGIASTPIDGRKIDAIIYAYSAIYAGRLIAQITETIRTAPESIRQAIKGTRARNFRDGVFFWRNNRLIQPNIDVVVNGTATNAANHVYEVYKVEMVEHLATLDFRTCPRCYAAEKEGPYPLGKQPFIPVHPRCLIGDTEVSTSSGVSAVSKRWFDGDVIVIRTATGKNLTCTPNHPILTRSGFVQASFLNVGGDVICDGSVNRKIVIDDDHQYVPTTIKKLSDAFGSSRQMATVKVPTASEDFHGDGMAGEVAVVSIYGKLLGWRDTTNNKKIMQGRLIRGADGFNALMLSANGHLSRYRIAFRNASRRVVSSFHLARSFLFRHLQPFQCFGFALSTPSNAVFFKNSCDHVSGHMHFLRDAVLGASRRVFGNNKCVVDVGIPVPELARTFGDAERLEVSVDPMLAYAELAGELLDGLSTGEVFADDVVEIRRERFSGHVYNLETELGFYTANGIVNHNCRCVNTPAFDDDFERPFVRDVRSVKDIPKHERPGKIGQTRYTIEEFFNRMTKQERRDYMGKSRFELWEAGKIDDIGDLVNQRTLESLTLDELPEL